MKILNIHRFVEHNKDEHCRGNVHINGMENFWSCAKEQMFKYDGVFRQNLFYYLKEMEWKFNNRRLRPVEKAVEIDKDFFHTWLMIGNHSEQAGFLDRCGQPM